MYFYCAWNSLQGYSVSYFYDPKHELNFQVAVLFVYFLGEVHRINKLSNISSEIHGVSSGKFRKILFYSYGSWISFWFQRFVTVFLSSEAWHSPRV